MPAIKPTKHKAFVREQWGWATAFADYTAPVLAEFTATSGLTLTFFTLGDADSPASSSTERATLPRALGEASTYEALSVTTYQGGTLRCIWNPQAATGEDDKKAWETLVEASTGYLWNAQNLPADQDLAAGDFVNILPAELGPHFPTKTGNGADAIWVFDAPVGIIGAPVWNVPVLAA